MNKSLIFKNAKFIKSAVKPNEYPLCQNSKGKSIWEIAVAGRSNVGKSTLINHLLQTKGLAKTSSTPGKTQLLNFFVVDDLLSLVDLPGYGYAKVPISTKQQWGTMIQTYLEKREPLKLILFLFDIRREPNEEDRLLMEWIAYNQKSVILVLTKVDKVKRQECIINTRKIVEAFHAENLHYVHYSATKNIGRDQLIGMLKDALKE